MATVPPNTFGTSTLFLPLIDPRSIPTNRIRFGRSLFPAALSLANSLYVPAGPCSARGFLLLRRSDYIRLPLFSLSLQLNLADLELSPSNQPVIGPVLSLGGLAIVQAQCVTRGITSDPNAIYLVEITDIRGILANRWFSQGTSPSTSFNIRAPAYPGTFYDGSMLGGLPYTWDQLARSLWTSCSPALPAYPSLPFIPLDTPEGWWFPGVSLWGAFSRILDYLGCQVSADLSGTNIPGRYGIVQDGAADAIFANLTQRYAAASRLIDDMEYIDVGAGRFPADVTVNFHRRNQMYGTEETVRSDSLQWAMTPAYSTIVPAPVAFSNGIGHHYLWADFQVGFDVDGNPLPADVATANAISATIVQNYYNKIYRGTAGYMRRLYAGVVPFYAGSLVDGVCWREGWENGKHRWTTEIVRGPQPPWPEIEMM